MKVALIIIFNHKYEKNIDLLKRIYGKRFTDIYYIMPFYSGNVENIIPVYENSYFFQGYIAQAFSRFYREDYDYYYFIGDDLLVNPSINESNLHEIFKLDGREAFISQFIQLHKTKYWQWTREAVEYRLKRKGTELYNELPSFERALSKFKLHGLELGRLKFSQVYRFKLNKWSDERFSKYVTLPTWVKHYAIYFINGNRFSLDYPLCGAYSDTFLVPAYAIKSFSTYCGIFAASELYVELAIPTALILSCDKILTEGDIEWKGKTFWSKIDVDEFLEKYNDINQLQADFPEKCLYIHPVKLSRWAK
jgi:hypothetical protein